MTSPLETQRRSVTCIFGAGETGKTTFAIRYLLNAADVACRFCFDPENEFASRLAVPGQSTPLEIEVAIRQGWCLFDPIALYRGNTEEALNFFADAALQFSAALPGRKIFCCDESWRHISPRGLSDDLLEVIKTGRKVGLESVWLSQEPRELNETILAEATEIICFRLDGVNSLGRLADYGFPRQEELPTLPRGRFIAWNKLSGGVLDAKLF